MTHRIEPTDERVKELIGYLDNCEWTDAHGIAAIHQGVTGKYWDARTIRELAAASDGRVGSGQKGYKLVRYMSREELDHACNWMNSQADKMRNRILKMRAEFAQQQTA